MATHKLTVLVIDDHPAGMAALRAVIETVLPEARVISAASGPQGLVLARSEDPDVMLLDILMPGMDGFAVCRALKADDNLRHIPVIFVTALPSDSESRQAALDAGAEGFLTKPPDTIELVAQIRAVAKIKAASVGQRREQERLAGLVAERTRQLELELAERDRSAALLRQSEELFRALAGATSTSIAVYQGERMVYANRSAVLSTGYSEDELLAMRFWDLIHPDSRELVHERGLARQRGEPVPDSYEVKIRRKDGQERWMDFSAGAITWLGEPAVVVTAVDITERASAEREAQRRADDLGALREIMIELDSVRDLSSLLQLIVERAARLVGADSGGMYICDEERQIVRCVVSYHTQHDYRGTVLKYGEGAAGTVAQTGQALVIDDYRVWPGRAKTFDAHKPFGAVLAMPMIWRGQTLGVIHVLHPQPGRLFAARDRDLLALFASQAACAVQNARLFDAAQKEIAGRKRTEEALRASEGSYRGLFDSISDAIYVLDREGRFMDINQRATEIHGQPLGYFVGKSLDVISAPGKNDLPAAIESIQAALAGESRQFEFWGMRSSGEAFPMEVRLSRGSYFRQEVVFALARDVTLQQRAEQTLRESEGRYRSLFNNAEVGMFRVRSDGSEILDVNDKLLRILGRTRAEMQGSATLIHWADPLEREEMMRRLAADGQLSDFECRMLNKQGEVLRGMASMRLFRDQGILEGSIQDVTERKRAEEALKASEERFRALIEHGSDAIALVAADGTVLYDSPSIALVLGYSPTERIGRKVFEFVAAEERQSMEQGFTEFAQQPGAVAASLWRFVHKDGSVRQIEGVRTNLLQEPAVRAVVVNCRDITQQKIAELKTQESQRKYQSLVETTSDFIWELDLNGAYSYCSPQMEKLWGLRPEEMIGKTPFDLLPPEARVQAATAFSAIAGAGLPFANLRFPSFDGGGQLRSLEISGVPFFDAAGKLSGYRGITRDVTEHMHSDAALKESEEMLRSVFATAPDPITVVDLNGLIRLCNQATADVHGYAAVEQLVGTSYVRLIAEEDRERAMESMMQVATVGCAKDLPFTGVKRNGDKFAGELSVTAIKDDSGRVSGFVGITRDVSRRKLVEAERERLLAQVRAQAQQISQIMDAVPEGVLLLGADGMVLLANPTGRRHLADVTGLAVGDRLSGLGDLSLGELLVAPDKAELWREVRHGERVFEVLVRPLGGLGLAAGDDSDRDSEASRDFGGAGHWVVVFNEVTAERAVQDQLQQQDRLAAIGQLAAGIAHDFNNIMSIILLNVPAVERAPGLGERDRERLAVIREQAGQAARLVQQMLDFSRRAVMEKQAFDLGRLLGEQVALLERTLPESIQVSLDLEAGLHVIVGDPTRIQQMVMNLAVNARDAMPGGGTLRLSLVRREAAPRTRLGPGPWLQLTVMDSGTGMPAYALRHVFEPFFSTKPRGQGTGLGLAQVHGIVKQHGGEIEVESSERQGTTFTIYLPAADVAPVAAPVPARVVVGSGGGQTILLVEDNEALREAMADLLEVMGYGVVSASNGVEALTALEEQGERIALVLSDLVMPVMGGEALFKAMRVRGLRTPVVMLSGHPLEGELVELQAQGVAGWLLKPPDMNALARLLARVLEGSPA